MIELRLLEQLAAFAECGTLSAASEKLHISQPTLTRSMRQLENELGLALFIRSKNHLRLNETGVRAAEYAGQVLSSAVDFENKIKAYDRSLHTLSIGYCAPVPQTVLTPVINTIYSGMTIAADMTDDADYEEKLKQGIYQLAVLHYKPADDCFYAKKCGSESLYISLPSGSPLSFYPQLHLRNLDGLSILLLQRIGFWSKVHRDKTPNSRYLLQIEEATYSEIGTNSEYPMFSSDYFIKRGLTIPGRINVRLADPECSTDYYLVCLKTEKEKHAKLFQQIRGDTIS